jgi:uncharacterized protein
MRLTAPNQRAPVRTPQGGSRPEARRGRTAAALAHPSTRGIPPIVQHSRYSTYVTEEILASHAVEAERIVTQAFLRRLPGDYDVAQAILFGSRARGDHRTDSDLDLAVVLKGRRGDFIDTKLDMAGVAFDVLMETGVLVQPLPLWDDDLAHPERFANPALIRTIVAEGIRLG